MKPLEDKSTSALELLAALEVHLGWSAITAEQWSILVAGSATRTGDTTEILEIFPRIIRTGQKIMISITLYNCLWIQLLRSLLAMFGYFDSTIRGVDDVSGQNGPGPRLGKEKVCGVCAQVGAS